MHCRASGELSHSTFPDIVHPGNAIDPRRTYSVKGYADALLEALASLGVERFAVVGHSLGGHVALEMVARNAAVDGALIFGTPPIANSVEGLQQVQGRARKWPTPGMRC